MTTRFRLYIAASVDGFIADAAGGVDWLHPFETEDYGYGAFLRSVTTIVMGRTTFDQALGFGSWPYPGKRTIVLTHRALQPGTPPDVDFHSGELAPLVSRLLAEGRGDVWICGGAAVIRLFLELGRVDSLELFVIPVLLGTGLRLFLERQGSRPLAFRGATSYPNGVVRLEYAPA